LRVRAAEDAVASLRQEFLSRRTSRLQAETLAATEKAREEEDSLRRGQRAVDDWYLGRMSRDNDEN
jgi:hypothetical protein